jgi:hypothetical protein
MSFRDSLGTDEWSLIRSAPLFVTAAVSAADPGGIFHAFKEATAGAAAIAQFGAQHPQSALIQELIDDHSIPALPDPRSLLGQGDSAQQSTNFQHAAIERATAALAKVGQHCSPAETALFRQLLNFVAEHVANAAVEGGFLGFGGVRVSDKEKSFLGALSAALDAPATPAGPAAPIAPAAGETSPAAS